MTEPPRPPGEGPSGAQPPDPTSPPPPPASYPSPGETPSPGYVPPPSAPPYEPPSAPQYGGPPPAGGQPPPGGYPGGPGYPAAPGPVGFASNDEKTWAMVAHFGGAAGMFIGSGMLGWVAPLVALLAKGNQSPTVRAHALAALNFQLLWSIIGLVGWILACIVIGFIAVGAAVILGIIFGVMAGIKANEGQLYRYPMSVNWIK